VAGELRKIDKLEAAAMVESRRDGFMIWLGAM
jgi:hypothetical protein